MGRRSTLSFLNRILLCSHLPFSRLRTRIQRNWCLIALLLGLKETEPSTLPWCLKKEGFIESSKFRVGRSQSTRIVSPILYIKIVWKRATGLLAYRTSNTNQQLQLVYFLRLILSSITTRLKTTWITLNSINSSNSNSSQAGARRSKSSWVLCKRNGRRLAKSIRVSSGQRSRRLRPLKSNIKALLVGSRQEYRDSRRMCPICTWSTLACRHPRYLGTVLSCLWTILRKSLLTRGKELWLISHNPQAWQVNKMVRNCLKIII